MNNWTHATANAVSLFSGGGGLDLGLEAAGWEVLVQIDQDPASVRTLELQAKRKPTPTLIVDSQIEAVDPRKLRLDLGLRKEELDLLAGGPPCQPFTTSGLRLALNDQRANTLFPAYFSFVDEFRPRSLLIENVDGMLSAALRHRPLRRRTAAHGPMEPDEMKGSFLRWFLGELRARGYSVTWGVVEAADHGVPQLRQRAVVVGSRGRRPCFFPAASHGTPDGPSYRTLRDALVPVQDMGPVQPLSARKQAVYSLIPPGGNWRCLPEAVRRETMGAAYLAEGGKSGWWRRLSWDEPAPTILGMPDHSSTALIHPDAVRCLSVHECAAIQTFPDWVRFGGTARAQYQQIGNAVPPLLSKALGTHLRAFMAGNCPDDEPAPPRWRQRSANRRIGVHGWAAPTGPWHLLVRIRPDHVWSRASDVISTPN